MVKLSGTLQTVKFHVLGDVPVLESSFQLLDSFPGASIKCIYLEGFYSIYSGEMKWSTSQGFPQPGPIDSPSPGSSQHASSERYQAKVFQRRIPSERFQAIASKRKLLSGRSRPKCSTRKLPKKEDKRKLSNGSSKAKAPKPNLPSKSFKGHMPIGS